MQVGLSAIGAGACLHAHQRGGGHLSARHAVYGIVYEDDGDVLATVQCLYGFACAYASQVAVALICEHQMFRPQSLQCRGTCRGTSVCRLYPIDVQIPVCKDSASHGAYAYGLFLYAHFVQNLGHQFVHYGMSASGAVVHGGVVHQTWFLVNDVLG